MSSGPSSDDSENKLETVCLENRTLRQQGFLEDEHHGESADTEMCRKIAIYDKMVANYQRMEMSYEVTKDQLRHIDLENGRFIRLARGLARDVQEFTSGVAEQLSDVDNDYFALLEVSRNLLVIVLFGRPDFFFFFNRSTAIDLIRLNWPKLLNRSIRLN